MKWMTTLNERVVHVWSGIGSKITAAKKALQEAALKSWQFTCQKVPLIQNCVDAYQKSHDVRTVASSTMRANLLQYAMPVVVYEGYLKPWLVKDTRFEDYADY